MDDLLIRFNHLDEQKRINRREFAKISDIWPDTLYRFLKGLDVSQRTRRNLEKGIRVLEGTQDAEKSRLVKKIPEDKPMEDRLLEMARLVLRSGTAEAAALHANIVAFFGSLGRPGGSSTAIFIEDPQEKGPGGSS